MNLSFFTPDVEIRSHFDKYAPGKLKSIGIVQNNTKFVLVIYRTTGFTPNPQPA
jgi:hypothetical protein